MNILFQQTAFTDYQQWAVEDKKIFSKIGSLIDVVLIAGCKSHYR